MTDGYTFLRFLYSRYSESEYLIESWKPIEEFLREKLANPLDYSPSRSSEMIYCQIYKATCKGYQEHLVDDLKKTMIEHCQILQKQLDENSTKINDYILQFIDYLHRFLRVIETINPLFHYLDVVYLKPKLKSTIRDEFLRIYKTILLETHLPHVFSALKQSISSSESISKERISSFLELIHDITPESMTEQRDFFQRYCDDEETPIRTNSKRSVDDLPGDEDQPAAKRSMHTIQSPQHQD